MKKGKVKSVKPTLVSFFVDGKVLLLTGRTLPLQEGQDVVLSVHGSKIVAVATLGEGITTSVEYRKKANVVPRLGRPCEIKTRVEFPLTVLMGKFMYPCEVQETYTDGVWVECRRLSEYRSEIQKWWEYRQKVGYTVTHKERIVRFYSDGTFSYTPEGEEYILNHYARNYGIMIGGVRIKKEVYFHPIGTTLTRDEKNIKDYFTWEDGEGVYGDEYEKLTTHVDHVQDEGIMTGWKTLGTRKEYSSSYVKGRDVEFVRTYTPKEEYEFLGTHNIGYVRFEPNKD